MPFILLFSFILIALEGCGMFEGEVVETSPPVYNRLIPIDPETGGEIPPGDPNTDPTDPGEEVVLDLVSGKYCSWVDGTESTSFFVRSDTTEDGGSVGGPLTRMFTRGSNDYGLRTGDPADSDPIPLGMTLFPIGMSRPVQLEAGSTHMSFLDVEDPDQTYPSWANIEIFGVNVDQGDYLGESIGGVLTREAYKVSTGHRHTAVLQRNNTVLMWGDNAYGQSGVPSLTDSNNFNDQASSPAYAAIPNPEYAGPYGGPGIRYLAFDDVIDVSAGAYHTCLIRGPQNESGDVWCKGRNNFGQSGHSNDTDDDWHQIPITNAVKISAGADHTCTLTTEGKVFCWGRNVVGQLGVSTTDIPEYTHEPQRVPNFLAKNLHVSYYATYAVSATGELYSWGDDSFGAGGRGTINGHVYTPTRVGSLSNVTDVGGTWFSIYAMTDVGDTARYYGWGDNRQNQIANGSSQNYNSPVEITVPVTQF